MKFDFPTFDLDKYCESDWDVNMHLSLSGVCQIPVKTKMNLC